MTRMKYLVAAATLSLFLAGCSGSKEEVPDNPPNEIYATAQQKLQDGNWRQAITQLEALDNRYPFGPYSQQVQLDLIYAYYKNADLPLAQAAIDRFIRLNPTHPNIDYVMYMRGLTNMALDDSALQGFFGVDRSDRDPQHARAYAWAHEMSSGKDTPSGHWEIAGVPVLFEWGYFSDHENSFPQELLDKLVERANLPGYLGNCHSSGTVILDQLGEEHMKTGKPIFYTSADSVFQIACHEETFGLDKLYELCEIAREELTNGGYNIGRVIARPFIGDKAGNLDRKSVV